MSIRSSWTVWATSHDMQHACRKRMDAIRSEDCVARASMLRRHRYMSAYLMSDPARNASVALFCFRRKLSCVSDKSSVETQLLASGPFASIPLAKWRLSVREAEDGTAPMTDPVSVRYGQCEQAQGGQGDPGRWRDRRRGDVASGGW